MRIEVTEKEFNNIDTKFVVDNLLEDYSLDDIIKELAKHNGIIPVEIVRVTYQGGEFYDDEVIEYLVDMEDLDISVEDLLTYISLH